MASCYQGITASRQSPLTNSIDCLFQNNVKEWGQIWHPLLMPALISDILDALASHMALSIGLT